MYQDPAKYTLAWFVQHTNQVTDVMPAGVLPTTTSQSTLYFDPTAPLPKGPDETYRIFWSFKLRGLLQEAQRVCKQEHRQLLVFIRDATSQWLLRLVLEHNGYRVAEGNTPLDKDIWEGTDLADDMEDLNEHQICDAGLIEAGRCTEVRQRSSQGGQYDVMIMQYFREPEVSGPGNQCKNLVLFHYPSNENQRKRAVELVDKDAQVTILHERGTFDEWLRDAMDKDKRAVEQGDEVRVQPLRAFQAAVRGPLHEAGLMKGRSFIGRHMGGEELKELSKTLSGLLTGSDGTRSEGQDEAVGTADGGTTMPFRPKAN